MIETIQSVGVESMIDSVARLGFCVGIAAAAYIREIKQYPTIYWGPFVAISLSFALFIIDGGRFDLFEPGFSRLMAMVALVVAELGLFEAIRSRDRDQEFC